MQETEQITRVEAAEATDEQLTEIAELADEIHKESLPDDPTTPPAEYIADIRSLPSYTKQTYWTLHQGDRLAGYSVLYVEFKDENKQLARVSASVRKELRKSKIGSRLLLLAAQEAKALGRTLVDGWVTKGLDGEGFASAVGAESAIENFHNRLMIADLDREMLEEWVRRAPDRASGYKLSFYTGATPDEDLGSMSALMRVMNTAPEADYVEDDSFPPEQVAEYERTAIEQGWVPWTLVAKGPDGEFAGFTRIYPNRFQPAIVYQEDTGVVPEHRNRGLGRWLKAAMMLKILDELPETKIVETGNAVSNQPMLGINNAMGFKPVETWIKMSIETDALIERLGIG